MKHLKLIISSIRQQYLGGWFSKLWFAFIIILHYTTKHLGLTAFKSIPSAKFLYSGNVYKTRKGTVDFMILRENYEPDITHFLNSIQQLCVFFDIGAHIGRYSILMAAKGHRVYSFEPIASNYEALNENLILNHAIRMLKLSI